MISHDAAIVLAKHRKSLHNLTEDDNPCFDNLQYSRIGILAETRASVHPSRRTYLFSSFHPFVTP